MFWLALFFLICAGQAATSVDQIPTWPGFAYAQSAKGDAKLDLVSQELRYHAPGAGEVYLVWGINGLQPVPEAIRPPGTYLYDNKVMRTHLVRAGETFTITLRVPRGARLDYSFMIATRKGAGATDIWQSELDSVGRPFTKDVKFDGRIEIESKAQLASANSDLVTQELRYHAPGAGEVYLVWGINGRQPVPEAIRPPDTYLDDEKVMRTRLVRAGDAFTAILRIPRGARLEYHFVLAIRPGGGAPDIWKNEMDYGYRPFTKEVKWEGRIEIQSAATGAAAAVTAEQRKAWLSGETTDIPLVREEILYHAPGAGEVWLVWGVEGWQAIPNAARPPATMLKDDGLMHTLMVRKNDTFATQVRLPPGIRFNYRFLITKTDAGIPINFREDAGGRSYLTMSTDSVIKIESMTIPVTTEQRKAWLAGKISDIPLVAQELSYRSVRSDDLWVLWGIDGWQAIPEAVRPPGTVLTNGLMYTHMVRKANTFTATVRVPPGTVINYQFLTDKRSGSLSIDQSDSYDGEILIAELDGRVEVESAVTKAGMEQRKSWPSGRLSDLSLLTHEVQYRIAGAEEVWLVWGINGWQAIPEAARPPGTVLKDNKIMHSPMVRKGDTFAITVRVPPGTMLAYKFLTTKTMRGQRVNIWQDYNGQDFWKLVRVNGSSEEKATVTVVTEEQRKAWLAGQVVDLPLVTQEIRYRAPGAAEVWLTWGIDGWQAVPDSYGPPGTIIKDSKLVQSPMVHNGDTFTTMVRLPPGAVLDYGFLITRTEEGRTVNVWQRKDGEGRAFAKTVMFDGHHEVRSNAWLSVRADERSLVSQEIRYRIAGAEEVWLVWGINDWQAIPEAARPPGTVLKDNKIMHSPMVRKGDTFAVTVRVPHGTKLYYRFFVTKRSRGVPVSLWQDADGQDFTKVVRVKGSLQETGTISVVTADQRKAWMAGQAADLPFVTQEIRYHVAGASEVWLVWGLEGWQGISQAARPNGTVMKQGRMHTPMLRMGNRFTTTVRLPPGTELNFSLLVSKTEEGKDVDVRQDRDEEGRPFTRVVRFDDRLDIQSLP